jgi:hypothetical protein
VWCDRNVKSKAYQIAEDMGKFSLVNLGGRVQQGTQMMFWKILNYFKIIKFGGKVTETNHYAKNKKKFKIVLY